MRAKATRTRGRLAMLLIASALLAGAMPVASSWAVTRAIVARPIANDKRSFLDDR